MFQLRGLLPAGDSSQQETSTVSAPPGLDTSLEGRVKNMESSLSFIYSALKELTQPSQVGTSVVPPPANVPPPY